MNNINRRLKRLEAQTVNRVLPQGYIWQVNGLDLQIKNLDTEDVTTIA